MDYNFLLTKKHLEDKAKRKRLLKNLSKDDKEYFEFLHEIICTVPITNTKEFFEMNNLLYDKKLKQIKTYITVLLNDYNNGTPLPTFNFFEYGLNSSYYIKNLRESPNKDDKELERLLELYVESYYLIKTFDLNMDYIKMKIKEKYPNFEKIFCSYEYDVED